MADKSSAKFAGIVGRLKKILEELERAGFSMQKKIAAADLCGLPGRA